MFAASFDDFAPVKTSGINPGRKAFDSMRDSGSVHLNEVVNALCLFEKYQKETVPFWS